MYSNARVFCAVSKAARWSEENDKRKRTSISLSPVLLRDCTESVESVCFEGDDIRNVSFASEASVISSSSVSTLSPTRGS